MAGPSIGQMEAVYAVMRLLREDDLARGLAATDTVDCTSCRRARPAVGAVRYPDDAVLCNGCATDYEILRLARLTPPLGVRTAGHAPAVMAGPAGELAAG